LFFHRWSPVPLPFPRRLFRRVCVPRLFDPFWQPRWAVYSPLAFRPCGLQSIATISFLLPFLIEDPHGQQLLHWLCKSERYSNLKSLLRVIAVGQRLSPTPALNALSPSRLTFSSFSIRLRQSCVRMCCSILPRHSFPIC